MASTEPLAAVAAASGNSPRTVSVFGLGYVGCISAACLARAGHQVIGVDVNPTKVDLINGGASPIIEPGIRQLIREMVETGRLQATRDGGDAVRRSDVSVVTVGTPSQRNGNIDLNPLERVCGEIGDALKEKSGNHVVVVRSTVLPGTMEAMVVPTLEGGSGRRLGPELGICLNPEFLREGTSLADFYDPPFTLIGTAQPAVGAEVAALYGAISAPLHVVDFRTAEMVKYACNAFHGVKVSFANEVGNVCKALGIDSHEVMRIFCEDKKLNLSACYLKPGFAFGGSCLPKDLRALIYKAKQVDVPTPLLAATLETNRLQIERALDLVLRTGARRVGVLGLSFKAGTDDLRESPMVRLVEGLIGKGFELAIYDEIVSASQVMGANKEYIEREIPHIWSLMRPTAEDVLQWADTIVVGSRRSGPVPAGSRVLDGHQVIDLVRAFEPDRSNGRHYSGICW